MNYLDEIDCQAVDFGDLYDELPLWSARFGLMLLDLVPLRPGITILDVGCGTGFMTIELAQRCGAAARVIAVDPWAAAMTRLTRKLNHLGIGNVQTLQQDVAQIDLADSSVDLIVSNLGLNNFDQPEAAMEACSRVAKSGADLFLTTNLVGHMAEFYEAFRGVLRELSFESQIPNLDAHIQHRATVDSVKTLLERSGFEFINAEQRSFQERFVNGSALLCHNFIRLGFVPAWKSVAQPGAVAETFAALEQRLNQMARERGELSLTIPAACIHARKPARA